MDCFVVRFFLLIAWCCRSATAKHIRRVPARDFGLPTVKGQAKVFLVF